MLGCHTVQCFCASQRNYVDAQQLTRLRADDQCGDGSGAPAALHEQVPIASGTLRRRTCVACASSCSLRWMLDALWRVGVINDAVLESVDGIVDWSVDISDCDLMVIVHIDTDR